MSEGPAQPVSNKLWYQNLDLTSSLYRCNSMGASILALAYRGGIGAYANSTSDTPLLKQTPPSPDCVYVHVCLCVRELCKLARVCPAVSDEVAGVTLRRPRCFG